MRGRYHAACLAVLLVASFAQAAPPDVPRTITAPAGQLVRVVAKGDAEIGYLRNFPDDAAFFDELAPRKGERRFVFQATKPGVYVVGFWTANEKEGVACTITVTGEVTPPDPPKPPDPPVPPIPAPTGFRVIFVYETANALTPAMQQVMFGEKVRQYLDAKTAPHPQGGKGWRRLDKDVDVVNEKDPDLKALWQTARPKVTTIPCVIVSVNEKAEIIPFPASEADALAVFAKYAEGK